MSNDTEPAAMTEVTDARMNLPHFAIISDMCMTRVEIHPMSTAGTVYPGDKDIRIAHCRLVACNLRYMRWENFLDCHLVDCELPAFGEKDDAYRCLIETTGPDASIKAIGGKAGAIIGNTITSNPDGPPGWYQ